MKALFLRVAITGMTLTLFAGPVVRGAENPQNIFTGHWKGEGEAETGRLMAKGAKFPWDITFNEQDPTKVEGIVINRLSKFKLKALNPAQRYVQFDLVYAIQGLPEVTITCKGTTNAVFTRIEGTYDCGWSAGKFAIARQNVAPEVKVLKGQWAGTIDGTKGGIAKKSKELKISFPDGTCEKAAAVLSPEEYDVKRIEPAAWNPATRNFRFVLVYVKNVKKNSGAQEYSIVFAGTFDEKYLVFSGKFQGALGEGNFTMNVTETSRPQKTAPRTEKWAVAVSRRLMKKCIWLLCCVK